MEGRLVSKPQLRGTGRVPLSLAGLVLAAVMSTCSRKAEIEDAPDGGTVVMMEIPQPDGGVPSIEDSGLGAGGAACSDRPSQAACSGANDFGCVFDDWIRALTETCQQATDCHTDGWVEVAADADGCASELRMEDPDADYVACMVSELNRYRCGQCSDVIGSRFLGVSNDGCPEQACGTGELRCPPGSICTDGVCVD
jgi:hypothetical protein